MRTARPAFLSVMLWLLLCVCLNGFAQPASAQLTVGDATRFLFEEGKEAAYGIQGHDVGQSQFGQDLFTRHEREGNTLGIGSSSLQTTNVSSESGTAAIAPFTVTSTERTAPRASADLNRAIQGFSATSPALSGAGITPSTGIYSGSGLTSPYIEMRGLGYQPIGIYQDLNTVPSFNRSGAHLALPATSSESSTDYDSMLRKGGTQY